MTQQMTVNAWADEFKNQRLTATETRVLAVVAAIGPVSSSYLKEIMGFGVARLASVLVELSRINLIALTARGWVVTTDAEMEGAQQS